MANPTQSAQTRDLVFSRVFDAPVEHYGKPWIEPELIMQWRRPEGAQSFR
jgi:uncharacterized protein YndB with AHSA1/START domain